MCLAWFSRDMPPGFQKTVCAIAMAHYFQCVKLVVMSLLALEPVVVHHVVFVEQGSEAASSTAMTTIAREMKHGSCGNAESAGIEEEGRGRR